MPKPKTICVLHQRPTPGHARLKSLLSIHLYIAGATALIPQALLTPPFTHYAGDMVEVVPLCAGAPSLNQPGSTRLETGKGEEVEEVVEERVQVRVQLMCIVQV